MANESLVIRDTIISALKAGYKRFLIYPFDDLGRICNEILREGFGIHDAVFVDNILADFNPQILHISDLGGVDSVETALLFVYKDSRTGIKEEVFNEIGRFFPKGNVYACFMTDRIYGTICGKYSSGPLCDHPFVEKVGSFCSFGRGADVAANHAMEYISTAPFLYYKPEYSEFVPQKKYDDNKGKWWYFEGVHPHGKAQKFRKVIIGNDVWIGKNVLICNGAYIGNGVIAGAGAVITKNVPDYAVVVGVPARIMRYRYTAEQIEALNRICWWDWPDDKIRSCYEDFYDNIDVFIKKHLGDEL